MVNKVLRVGDSAAVTIPKQTLKSMGLHIGDRVVINYLARKNEITITPLQKDGSGITTEFAGLVQGFIERYRTALQELAKR